MIDVLGAIARQAGQAPPPRLGSDSTTTMVAVLVSPPDASYIARVSILGSEPIPLPAVTSAYVGVTTVHILFDAATGRPVMVLGPAGAPTVDSLPPPAVPPPTTPSGGTQPVTRTVTGRAVLPTATGTWRAARSAWDRWNVAGDIYQAGSASSGPLSGIACYGDQVTALGASKITRAVLTLVSSGAGLTSSWTAGVTASPHGSLPATAPTFLPTPATTVTVAGHGHDGEAAYVEVSPAILEDLRTGTARALGLPASGTYGGTRGIRDSRSWTLSLDYEVPA